MPASADIARAFRVFERALDLAAPVRARWLDTECGADPALRAEVDALLARNASACVETDAMLSAAAAEQVCGAGRVFGHFRTCECIGSGGMGVVFRAQRTDGIAQTVALKLLRHATAGGALERFEREMRTLARLEHPAVARLIDAGVDEDATPWLAMEYVHGQPVDDWCQAQRATIAQRVRILAQLADAVCAAHRMFVVHRDIKPSNVLVQEDGSPKLIDFGIAKLLDDQVDLVPLTRGGGALFTPQYASPEQVTGAPITTAADVFGLGALGYRLLTGRSIFPDTRTAALPYMLAVTQRDVTPASRAAALGGAREADVRALKGDLEAILGRALEREPGRRYASAADLRDDLMAYLEHRPVRARRPTLIYRSCKFVRRNAFASAMAAVVVVGGLGGAVAFGLQAREVTQQRDAARVATARTQRVNDFLMSMLQAADPGSGGRRDVTVSEMLDAAVQSSRTQLINDPSVRGQILATIALTDYQLGRYSAGRAAVDESVELLGQDPGDRFMLAQALEIKGYFLRDLGDESQAEGAVREEIALLGMLPGTQREQAAALKALGMILQRGNHADEAVVWYRRALDMHRGLGGDDPEYADTMISLGEALQSKGNYAESLALEQQGLAMARRTLPADHPGVLGGTIAVAEALQSVGRIDEAEALHRQLLTDRQRVLGPLHLDTLISQLSLSGNLRIQGRYGEAIDLARVAASQLRKVAGPQHRTLAFGLSMQAMAQCLGGQAADGLTAAEEAQRIREARFDPQDRRVVLGRLILSICRDRLGMHGVAAQQIMAQIDWQATGSGSYADLPALARDIVAASGGP